MVSLRSLVICAALVAAPVLAALTPSQIYDSFNKLSEQALALQGPAAEISIVNAPLIVTGRGPFPVYLPAHLLLNQGPAG
jgi:hypothetical protein